MMSRILIMIFVTVCLTDGISGQMHPTCVYVEPVYNDRGLCDTSPIASDILWYQLIPHC